MGKILVLGGVSIDEDIIHKYNVTADVCEITLKQGTHIIYRNQPSSRHAEITQTLNKRIDFKGLVDATIIDTEKNDIYRLLGCENVAVCADRGDSSDQDLVEIYHRLLPDKTMQYSKNNILKLNKGDLYKLPEDTTIKFVQETSEQING